LFYINSCILIIYANLLTLRSPRVKHCSSLCLKNWTEDLAPPAESELHAGDEGFVKLTWRPTNISSKHQNKIQPLKSISPSPTAKPDLRVRATQRYLDHDDDGFESDDYVSQFRSGLAPAPKHELQLPLYK